MPLISIIIPVYNVEKYLRECLDSVINQTYKDIEIIIINDCTKDNSEEIILEYERKDNRIKYIKHEKNKGLGGARNTGILNATTDWIIFLDSDDYLELNCIENLMISLKNNPSANLAIFSVMNFTEEKKWHSPYFDIPNEKRAFPFIATTACGKVFKLKDIIDNQIFFPEHLKHEDEEFWWKYNSVVNVTYVTDISTNYQYRQRGDSIMASSNTSRLDLPIILENIINFIRSKETLYSKRSYLLKVINRLTDANIYSRFAESDKKVFLLKLYDVFDDIELTEDEILTLFPIIQSIYIIKSKEHIDVAIQNFKSYTDLQSRYTNLQSSYTDLQSNYTNLQSSYTNLQSSYTNLQSSYTNLQSNKWYRFGQLSRKQKIKKIIVVISKKMKIYPILKVIYKPFKK